MIDYNLYRKLSDWVIANYPNRVYQEENPRTYTGSNSNLIWQNIGIRLIQLDSLTIAILFEYDENNDDAGVYVGLKCLDCPNDCKKLRNSLPKEFQSRAMRTQTGAHNRLFSWVYWCTINNYTEGIQQFLDLVKETELFILKLV